MQPESKTPPPPLHRSLRQRVGGRWAVSLRGFAVLGTLSIPALLLTEPPQPNLQLHQLLLIAAGGAAALGIVLYLANLTVLKGRRESPVAIWVVVSVGIAAGIARSVETYIGLAVVDVPQADQLWSRIATGAVLGGIYVPVTAYVLDVRDQFSQEKSRLLNVLARERTQDVNNTLYLQTLRSALLDDTQKALDETLQPARDLLDSQNVETSDSTIINALRRAVDAEVRDASHQLWGSDIVQPRSRMKDVVAFMTSTQPFYPLWLVVPVCLAAFFPLARTIGPSLTLEVTAAGAVYLLLVTNLANSACRRWRQHSTSIFWLAEALLLLTGPFLALLVSLTGEYAPGSLIGWAVITSFAVTVIATLTGIVPALMFRGEQVLEALRVAVSQAEVVAFASQLEVQRARRDVARYLHGTVRANIATTIFRLEQALEAGDDATFFAVAREAKQYLEVDVASQLTYTELDLPSEMGRLRASWHGLVDIRYAIGGDIRNLPPYTARAVIDLVTEAVQNAARHALATVVIVRIAAHDSLINIAVDNDGIGEVGQGSGLGTRTLDMLSPGTWSLAALPDGKTRLTASLSLL